MPKKVTEAAEKQLYRCWGKYLTDITRAGKVQTESLYDAFMAGVNYSENNVSWRGRWADSRKLDSERVSELVREASGKYPQAKEIYGYKMSNLGEAFNNGFLVILDIERQLLESA